MKSHHEQVRRNKLDRLVGNFFYFLFQKLSCLPLAQDLPVHGGVVRPARRLLVPQLHLLGRNCFRVRLLTGDSGKNLDRVVKLVCQETGNCKNWT